MTPLFAKVAKVIILACLMFSKEQWKTLLTIILKAHALFVLYLMIQMDLCL